MDGLPLQQVDDGHHQECRQHDQQVSLELVPHLAPGRPGRRDRRIGYEGKVVAEKGAADNYRRQLRRIDAGLPRNAGGDRDQGDNRADAGAHRERDEARRQEKTCEEHLAGNDPQGEMHGRIDGADLLRRCGKGAGQDEDPDHQKDVRMSGPFGKDRQALVEPARRCDGHGINGGEKERGRDRDLVEIPGNQGTDQINSQKNDDGTQGQKTLPMPS